MPPRKAPARAYLTLEQLEHRRIVDVELEEGAFVRFRPPDLEAFIRAGTVPNPLRAAVEREQYGPSDPKELTLDQRLEHYDLQCYLIATHLVEPDLLKETGSEDAAVEWVKENIQPRDRVQLYAPSMHLFVERQGLESMMGYLPFLAGSAGTLAADNGGTNGASSE